MNILDMLLDAVCVVDEDGVFLSASGAVEAIFGYTVDEMIGRSMIELVHPDDVARTQQAAARLMLGKLQYDFENRYIRKDGRVVHLMWSARWYPEQGIRVAVARDVTARYLPLTPPGAEVDASQSAFTETNQPVSVSIPGLAADEIRDNPVVRVPAVLALPRWRLLGAPPQLVAPNGAVLRLSGQDYIVMKAITGARRVVSRREIVEALGHVFIDYDQRRLDTQMRRLRRRVLEVCGLKLPITTLRSVGFRFYEDVVVDTI